MKAKLAPKESGDFIVKHAQYVRVHDEGVMNLSKKVRIS